MTKFVAGVMTILLVALLSLLLTYPYMWLINYVFSPVALTTVFGVSQITFWKTYGLALICGLLFKSSSKEA